MGLVGLSHMNDISVNPGSFQTQSTTAQYLILAVYSLKHIDLFPATRSTGNGT
jgi:hypothetical protein